MFCGSFCDIVEPCKLYTSRYLTLFRMGIFGAGHGWRWGQKGPLPKISHTYPTMMKLGTIIPYLKRIQKVYESRDTLPDFCCHQHFSREISKFCYFKKYRYILHFGTEFLIILSFPESLKICLINLVIILMMSGLVKITVF